MPGKFSFRAPSGLTRVGGGAGGGSTHPGGRGSGGSGPHSFPHTPIRPSGGSGAGGGSGSGPTGAASARMAAWQAAIDYIKSKQDLLEAYMRLFNANNMTLRSVIARQDAQTLLAIVQREATAWAQAHPQPQTQTQGQTQGQTQQEGVPLDEETPPYMADPPPPAYTPPAPPELPTVVDPPADEHTDEPADEDKSAATDAVDQKSFFETYKTPIYVVAGAAGLYFLAKYAKSQGWIK